MAEIAKPRDHVCIFLTDVPLRLPLIATYQGDP